MIAVGIDVSKSKSTVAILNSDGSVLVKPYTMAHTQSDMCALADYLRTFDEPLTILMEYTGHYHYPVLKKLQQEGFPVCVINPYQMKKYGDVEIHKAKTDKKDAIRIATYALEKAYKLVPYNSLEQKYEDLKFLSRQYNQRISSVSYTKVQLINLLDQTMPGITLNIVRERITELEMLKEKHGISPWLLYETPYERVYGDNTQNNQQKAAMVAVLCLSLLLAGIFSYEKQSGTDMLISSCVNGRKKLLSRKFGICVISAAFIWAVIYGTEIYNFLSICTLNTLSAPIQSLSMFAKFPMHCSIAVFLVLLYMFRLLMLCCVGFIVLFVSSKLKRVSTSYVATVGIVVVPSAIYYFIGISPLKIISTTVPVSATSLLLNTQGALSGIVIVGLIMIGIAVICACLVRKQQSSN